MSATTSTWRSSRATCDGICGAVDDPRGDGNGRVTLYALDGIAPEVDPTAWIAPGAHVIGKVTLHAQASVWFGAAIRGDNEPIVVGEGSNVQELACLHTDSGFPLTIGRGVTVGHRAMLHGCTVGDGALIGMGASVLNGATIGEGAVVGAGALVPEGKSVPPGTLVVGAPAKAVRELTGTQQAAFRSGAAHYVSNAERFRDGLVVLDEDDT